MNKKKRAFVDSVLGCVILTILMFLSWMFLSGPFTLILGDLADSNPDVYTILRYATSIYQIIPCVLFMLIYEPDRSLFTLVVPGKGNTVKNALIGLALGFGINGACALVALISGDIHLCYNQPNWFYIILAFFAVLLQSGSEEFICRLFLYQHLIRGYNNKPWIAIVLPSLIFSALHLANPGTDAISVLDTLVIGIVWALTIYCYDSFWMAWMHHTAWNYMQSILFGLPNSGMTFSLSVFKLDAASAVKSFSYDPIYGIEASAMAFILDSALLVVLLCFAVRKYKSERTVTENTQQ